MSTIAAFVRMRIASSTLNAITGIMTFSSSCPCSDAMRDRRVEAHHLEADLIHHLGNRRIHLARHDRRSRLHGGQLDLVDARARSHHHQAQVARDLAQVDRQAPSAPS